MRTRNVVLLIVAPIAFCAAGSVVAVAGIGGGAAVVQKAEEDRSKDITIKSCKAGEFGTVEVAYTIVNSSDTTQTYIPQFSVTAKDGTIVGEASDITSEVPAGKTYKGEAVGTVSGKPGTVTCSLSGS